MIGWIDSGPAADGRRCHAIGVPEVNLGSGHGVAVLYLHERHPVLAGGELPKCVTLANHAHNLSL